MLLFFLLSFNIQIIVIIRYVVKSKQSFQFQSDGYPPHIINPQKNLHSRNNSVEITGDWP